MGCSMGRVKSVENQKEAALKEHPLLWLIYKENHMNEGLSDYNPQSQVPQYNVVVNGILFQVINPIEDVEQALKDHINNEIV